MPQKPLKDTLPNSAKRVVVWDPAAETRVSRQDNEARQVYTAAGTRTPAGIQRARKAAKDVSSQKSWWYQPAVP